MHFGKDERTRGLRRVPESADCFVAKLARHPQSERPRQSDATGGTTYYKKCAGESGQVENTRDRAAKFARHPQSERLRQPDATGGTTYFKKWGGEFGQVENRRDCCTFRRRTCSVHRPSDHPVHLPNTCYLGSIIGSVTRGLQVWLVHSDCALLLVRTRRISHRYAGNKQSAENLVES